MVVVVESGGSNMANLTRSIPGPVNSSDIDTSYPASANSHRHNHTVSSISHISRATIHDDDLPAPEAAGDLGNGEGDKQSSADRSVSAGHTRSKSAFVDQSYLSLPARFESFSSSVGFPSSAVRRPSVACLKVNVNAARAGKHRIEHIESPALVLESGFGEGQTNDSDKPMSSCSSKSKTAPSHPRQTRHRLTIPDNESAQTDSWSAYLDTSCDSASNFIPSLPKSKSRSVYSDLSVKMPKNNRSQAQAKSSTAMAHVQKRDKKHLLSFAVGEHSIALSEKEHQQVIVIEPKMQAAQDDISPAFVISQGKSINEALRKLSLESNTFSQKTQPSSPSSRSAHFSRKEISRLRKTLVEICTIIVDEAVRNVYDESKYWRRQQRKLARSQDSINEMFSAVLTKTLSNWRKAPKRRPRQKKSWNTTESCSELSTDETSAEDGYTLSDDQSAFSEQIRSVLQR